MSARYLVRFDDICPTMDWAVWERVDEILVRHQVKPLLAVVPDNQDPTLVAGPARDDFWDYIRQRQTMGWSIAMHGFNHHYETQDGGLLGINRYSEFSGLPYASQKAKISKALQIFESEQIRIDAWVAPGHNFDTVTLEALREFGIHIVSDGFYSRPVRRLGAIWVPQQMWRFRKALFGTWTVCFHSNQFSAVDLEKFSSDIQQFRPVIVSLQDVLSTSEIPPLSWRDEIFSACWRAALLYKTKRSATAASRSTRAPK